VEAALEPPGRASPDLGVRRGAVAVFGL